MSSPCPIGFVRLVGLWMGPQGGSPRRNECWEFLAETVMKSDKKITIFCDSRV